MDTSPIHAGYVPTLVRNIHSCSCIAKPLPKAASLPPLARPQPPQSIGMWPPLLQFASPVVSAVVRRFVAAVAIARQSPIMSRGL